MVPRRRGAPAAVDAVLRPRALRAGNRLDGPAIVNQYDSTTVIPPGVVAHVDRYGNIVIEVARRSRRSRSPLPAVPSSQGV